jgi:hypothetical protein
MRAADCSRTFTLLADGGVLVHWTCGAEAVDREETAVDVDVLADRFPQHHHHRLHVHRHE